MFPRIQARAKDLERAFVNRFGRDISTPSGRRAAWWHFHLLDHGLLRVWWTNFAEIAPGIWRANQPSPSQLRRFRDRGLRTVVNLRGDGSSSPTLFEREACIELGLTYVPVFGFSASRLPTTEAMFELERILRDAERPLLMHCKSGADRTGLAAAIYLLLVEGRPVAEAAKQLSFRFLHRKRTATGVLDHLLAVFAYDHARTGISFRDWLQSQYDPDALTRSFADLKAGTRPAGT